MNVSDGSLYPYAKIQEDAFLRKMCVPVDAEQLTTKQVQTQQVSVHDHRSPVGIQLTSLRKAGRNDPCPCGSGKKFKFCHLNV